MKFNFFYQYLKFNYLIILCLLLTFKSYGQDQVINENPKLVVGIVVDQMRYDYLTRFWDRYGDDGFKRIVNEGFNFKNHHYNYIPTYTGPGHTSVWTGTTPMNHGIIGNNFYDKTIKEMVYCASDPNVEPIGTQSSAGKMSPHRMKTTTVADQNRLHTQMRGKTIGVAIKDRGSILPAGHTANAAYWFLGGKEGRFITSSFYRDDLPGWVKDFNRSGKAESYLKNWNTLYNIDTYQESGNDKNSFEGGFKGKKDATFPYALDKLSEENGGFSIIANSAYGNDLTLDFALAAIEAEELGQDNYTDFLTLSFSSTDKVGHNFGVNSKEIEDTYLRLDKNIEQLLTELDKTVGKGNYTIFLTADHGGGQVPSYLDSLKIPAGYFDYDDFNRKLNNTLAEEFGVDNLIENTSNNQIFLNYKVLHEEGIDVIDLQDFIVAFALQRDQIDKVFTRAQMMNGNYTKGIAASLQNGFNQKRSGDIILVLDPSTISYSKTGSTHGSGLMYDTHVPLLFYGTGIKQGSTTQRSEIPDIAPTVSALLGIAFPNGATGSSLFQMLDK